MSIECLNQALKIEFEGQTPTKRLILILLANYCDDRRTCYPSHKHIAKLAGLKDPRHIARIIKEFADLGLLRVDQRIDSNGAMTSNLYTLTLEGHTPPQGLQTPTPLGEETPTPPVSAPPNTKDKTKEETLFLLRQTFDDWWQHYPRKVGRAEAFKKWKAAVKLIKSRNKQLTISQIGERLNVAVLLYAAELELAKTEQRFICHASTWLHQERWVDYKERKAETKRSLNRIAG